MKGTIYLVPTPIGNLGDITLRALEMLKNASLIACEDTRKTAFLLNHYQIKGPKLISFHKFNERQREEALLNHLEEGKSLVIVSDAGSPAISDPANLFVKLAIAKGYIVHALPGATALIPAISISGMDTSCFQFLGFLPSKASLRRKLLKTLITYPYPTILYESVHHIMATLQEIYAALGDRDIAIAREISKLHEECIRGKLSTILIEDSVTAKGEFVIVIDGAPLVENDFPSQRSEEMVTQHQCMKSKELANLVAETFSISKSAAYEYILEHRKK